MKKELPERELVAFINKYEKRFPDETHPSLDIVRFMRYMCDVVLETERNLLFMKRSDAHYEVIGHWCLAHKDENFRFNSTAFSEILKLWRSLNKKVYFEELNEAYRDVVNRHNARFK